ncbi:lipid asymmetry maintenance protein MlaB [Herbaspirillum lusitanum]|uniref:STAS domain-containing protein n=1 Tax=Herbaspirillum lusitanum TaxID=213312 RepID=UPI00030A1797|nr:STAS domain-containing protein [Herbaspirillum lusitanum]MCW5297547.1 anti-sigma factor antagonist [Herbaspirillum lusitanum]
MSLTQSTRDGHLLLQVSGGLTIFQAAEYKPQLLGVLDNADDVLELDLSGCDEIDTAGVQLLLLLRREATVQYKQLSLYASPAVQNVLDMLHLQDFMRTESTSPQGPA